MSGACEKTVDNFNSTRYAGTSPSFGKVPVTEAGYYEGMNNSMLSSRRHPVRPLRHLRPANNQAALERFYFQTISVWNAPVANDNAAYAPSV